MEIFIETQKQLEKWFEKNYDLKQLVWLIFYKKSSNKAQISMDEIIDTLLCYGWIDSIGKKFDDEKTMLRISPRNPKSNWSRVNKEKVARLLNENRIKPSGMKLIKLAKQTGTWDALNDVENLKIPDDLNKKLNNNSLNKKWEEISRSTKRAWLESLYNAKKQVTRDKQIAKIISELITKT